MSNEHTRQSEVEAILAVLAWAKNLAKGCPDHPEYRGASLPPDFKCYRCLQVWAHFEEIEDMKQKGLISND